MTAVASSQLSPRRRWAALAVLTLAILLLAIDATVLALAVPALTEDLGPTATQILWIGDIYSLAISGLLVTMGNVADRIGRKKLLLIGATAFGLASILAAFSTTPEMLIASRFVLGVAGATLMPSTLSLIRAIFTDPAERTRAIAIWSAAAAGGSALGPLVGGFLLGHFWWGSVFIINVPIMVLLVIAGALVLPESRNPHAGPIDLLSVALSMLAIVPLVYAIKHLVTDGLTVSGGVCVIVGLGAGWWFVRRQRTLRDPLIDVDLFRRPAFAGAVLANFVAIFALTGLLFFFSQYLQLARGFEPLQAGLAELPGTLSAILVVLVIGAVLRRLGQGPTIAFGLVLVALGLVLVALTESSPNFLWLALALVPLGLGVGIAQTVTTDAVVSAVPTSKAGAASGISETSYELGAALGIAVLGSIVNLGYRAFVEVPAGLSAAQTTAVNDSLASALTVLDPASPAGTAAREAFTHSMQITSLVAAVITLAAAFIAWRTIPAVAVAAVEDAEVQAGDQADCTTR